MSRFNGFLENNPSLDWTRRWSGGRRLLLFLERLTLALERPVERFLGDVTLNPLYHTGTITIFLLLVILVTGLYLTMFYPFGFTLSYQAVGRIEANAIGRIVRAVHRYASQAVLVTSLLHGWRLFFQNRFRGARWLAWVSGVAMVALLVLIGISGYWLIWDERAHLLTQSLVEVFQRFESGRVFLLNFLVRSRDGWEFMLLLLLLHLGISVLVGVLTWLHLKRLSRPKWLPPRHWMVLLGLWLLLLALLFPVGMLPPFNPARLPERTPLDLFYLFYLLPSWKGGNALFWGLSLALLGLGLALPWVFPARKLPPVRVDLARCTGCTLCARDCPYGAIEMAARSDGRRPQLEARIHPERCVACGVCLGSCPENALSLDERSLDSLFDATRRRLEQNPQRVLFTCERHLTQTPLPSDPQTLVIPLTCIGMAPPKLIALVATHGARMEFLGCPAEDCAAREGNLWMQERLKGARLPKLKPIFREKVDWAWSAPGHFPAFSGAAAPSAASTYASPPGLERRRPWLALSLLLAFFSALLLWLGSYPLDLQAERRAWLNIGLVHRSGLPVQGATQPLSAALEISTPSRLRLEVDGQIWVDEVYLPRGEEWERAAFILKYLSLPAGDHTLRLTLQDGAAPQAEQVLFAGAVQLQPRQVFSLAYHDAHLKGDPAAGRRLFLESSVGTNAGCRICHSLTPGEVIVGPSLAGIATRAATRVPGLSAEEYIRQSILEPDAYTVPGFPKGQMVQNLGEILTPEQIDDLLAFLMTLK